MDAHIEYLILAFVLLCVCIWINSSKPHENRLVKVVLQKMMMYLDGIYFMIICKENKGLGPKKNPDPDNIKDVPCKMKRIIFIRHGESDWNDVFNKGFGPMLLVRLIKAMIREFFLMVTMDSVFLDSPLNGDGTDQARELRRYIEADNQYDQMLSIMRGDSKETSVIVSSNLRRALATTTLALYPRLQRTKEKIMILSSLQEISRNVDTKALASAKTIPDLNRLGKDLQNDGYDFIPTDVYDPTENNGNKSTGYYGIKRLQVRIPVLLLLLSLSLLSFLRLSRSSVSFIFICSSHHILL